MNAQGEVLFCQAPGETCGGCMERRDPGVVVDHERPLPHCSEDRAKKIFMEPNPDIARPKISGLQ
jgi:hypothetical protein